MLMAGAFSIVIVNFKHWPLLHIAISGNMIQIKTSVSYLSRICTIYSHPHVSCRKNLPILFILLFVQNFRSISQTTF